MSSVQAVLDRYADEVPYEVLSDSFLALDRWTGDDPRLLVAEAAASTTGKGFVDGIEPAVARFRDAFVATGRIESLADLAAVDVDDDALGDAFGARRERHVLRAVAAVLAERPERDDLESLCGWAAEADHYRYEDDPVGRITGVGPSSFQYLRQLAGIDTVCPDPTLTRFVETLADELDAAPLETTGARETIASCEWLSVVSAYRPIDVDRIAWWTFTDAEDRDRVLEVHSLSTDRA